MSEHLSSRDYPSDLTARKHITRLALVDSLHGNNNPKSVEFAKRFVWRPHWQAELTAALDGLDQRIADANVEGGLSAAYKEWDNARKYHSEAAHNFSALQNARFGALEPSAEQIKKHHQAMTALAEFLLAMEGVSDKYKPHNRHGRPTIARRKRIEDTANGILDYSDESVVLLWRWVLMSEIERARFWERHLIDVSETPIVKDLIFALSKSDTTSEQDEADYLSTFSE